MVDGLLVFGIESVSEIVSFFKGEIRLTPHTYTEIEKEEELLDFRDVKGQGRAKRALEIAAAGGHNLLRAAEGSFGNKPFFFTYKTVY